MSFPDRPSKQDAFLALLREDWTSLHLDARRPGVIVPAQLRNDAHLVLQYGHDLPIPIPDLVVDDYGVHATLSFSRTPHPTVVPWSAVYIVACADGRGVLYHEDVPEDVSIVAAHAFSERVLPEAEVTHEEAVEAGRRAQGAAGAGAGTAAQRLLRSVPADPAAELVQEPIAARRRRRPQLRLVK
jgi:stringent starvation protein B